MIVPDHPAPGPHPDSPAAIAEESVEPPDLLGWSDRIESIASYPNQPHGLIGKPDRPGRVDGDRINGKQLPSLERDFAGLQSVEANHDRVLEGPDVP